MSDKTFSEEEIAKIIRRASELEAGLLKKRTVSENGLTLDELTDLASEIGINPEFIREAASELKPAKSVVVSKKNDVAGEIIYSEQIIDFIPDTDALDTILNELNHNYKSSTFNLFSGIKNKRTGNRLDWSHMDSSGSFETSVLMQPYGDKYKVRVTKRSLWGMSFKSEVYFYLFFIVLFGGGAMITSSIFMDLLWMAIILTVILTSVSFPILKNMNTKKINRFENECEVIVKEIVDNLLMLNKTEVTQEKKIVIERTPEKPIWEDHEPGTLRNHLKNKEG